MPLASERLARRLRADFGSADAVERVVGSLEGERLQAAVVLWARGDHSRLQDAATLASQDWRDALVRAGLADDDWKERLNAELGPVSGSHQPHPLDRDLVDMLQGRLGRTTIVELRDGRRLRVINVAWGYDTGDTHAHVTSNVSPGIEGEAVDVFNTADVRRVLAESGEVLYRRG